MEEASRLCDRLVIMDDGRIIETGSPRELIGRHAGDQVLEVRWPLGLAAPELESGDGIRRLERAGDRILFFTPDPAAALVRMRQRLPADAALIRPATLEDVFIHLTGRALREDG
jgi:lipooligosaccharide transport system ATP-binding protein